MRIIYKQYNTYRPVLIYILVWIISKSFVTPVKYLLIWLRQHFKIAADSQCVFYCCKHLSLVEQKQVLSKIPFSP